MSMRQMGLCFSKDVRELDNSHVTPEIVSPQYYYSGIIRLSSFRNGLRTPPGVAELLESPRISSIALDSATNSVSVSSRDFILSPRILADVGDVGALNASFNRSRMGSRPGIVSSDHRRPERGGGWPVTEHNEGEELQVDQTVYSMELSLSQRLAMQEILQCVDKGSKKHCICCTDCGSKSIAKCRECGSDKLAICPMCDNRIPRCGKCRFGKPLSCGACGSTRLSSSLQIVAGKVNCGCCGAIMLASCDRCSTRFKRPTCGQCGRPSTDAESCDKVEESSEFGLDQSVELDSAVEFPELGAGVVELTGKTSPGRLPQLHQNAASLASSGPLEAAQQHHEQQEQLRKTTQALSNRTNDDPDKRMVESDAASKCGSGSDSSGEEIVIEVAHAAVEADTAAASFSSFPVEPASETSTHTTDGLKGSNDEVGQPFESVAEVYAEIPSIAAVRSREENDAFASPNPFKSAPSTEHAEWSVPFLSLETVSNSGSTEMCDKAATPGVEEGDQILELWLTDSSEADSSEQAPEAVLGTMRISQKQTDREGDSEIDRAQLCTDSFSLDSLRKERTSDHLIFRNAAMRQEATESGVGSGAVAGVGVNIAQNSQRKPAGCMRTTGKEKEIIEVEDFDAEDNFISRRGKEKSAILSCAGGGLFLNKQGTNSKAFISERIREGPENSAMSVERAFIRYDEERDEAVKVWPPDNHINMSEFIEAVKASSKVPREQQTMYSLTKGPEYGDGAVKAVTWGSVVREPRSLSLDETRTRHPIFEDETVGKRRHSVELDGRAFVRESDLKSCLKTKSSVPSAPSSLNAGLGTKQTPSSKPRKVSWTFNADPLMPQTEAGVSAHENEGKFKQSQSYALWATHSMVQAYDSDVSANCNSCSQPEKQSVFLGLRGPSVTLDSNIQVNRPLSRWTTSVESVDQDIQSSGGIPHPPGKASGADTNDVSDDGDHVSVQDLCNVLSLSSIERGSPTHRSSRNHGSESRMGGSLRRSLAGGKMSAMGISSSSRFICLRNYEGLEEEIENFLGASPNHNKNVRKVEVQRKVNQIAAVAHLQKQQQVAEARQSDFIWAASPLENVPLDTIAKGEERAMAYLAQSRKTAVAGVTSYTNIGSPASSTAEEDSSRKLKRAGSFFI